MGLYGSSYDYIIHVGIISTMLVPLITSFQPSTPRHYGIRHSGTHPSPITNCFTLWDYKQQTQLVRTSKNDFIIVRRRKEAHCYQEYTIIISEECFTKVLEVFE